MRTESSPKTILLIDDDRELHLLHHLFIKKQGYTLVSAYSGQEGLERALEKSPDLILLDNMMPGMSGETVLAKIAREDRYEKLRDTPIVMLTAANQKKEYISDLLRTGLTAYLHKPFGHRELLDVIESILSRQGRTIAEMRVLEKLRQSSDFFEGLVKNFPGIFFTTDLEGKITFFCEGTPILGFTPQQVINKFIFDLCEIEITDFEFLLRLLQKDKTGMQRRAVMKNSLAQETPVELLLSLYNDSENNAVGVMAVARDLTAQMRLEMEKIERERIVAIAQAMATVNHEVNNPLTPIVGNLQLLLEDDGGLPDEVKTKLLVILENAQRIARSVQKMQHISKPILKEYYDGEMIIDLEKSLYHLTIL